MWTRLTDDCHDYQIDAYSHILLTNIINHKYTARCVIIDFNHDIEVTYKIDLDIISNSWQHAEEETLRRLHTILTSHKNKLNNITKQIKQTLLQPTQDVLNKEIEEHTNAT